MSSSNDASSMSSTTSSTRAAAATGPAALAQLTVPASLYFITLAAALSLVVFISTVMIGRMALVRARERRLQRAGLAPVSSKGYEPAPPKMCEIWIRVSPGSRCAWAWADILPVAAAPQPLPPTSRPRAGAALRPPTILERVLRLPPLPVPDEELGESARAGPGKINIAVLVAMPRPRRDVLGDVVLGTAAPVQGPSR